MPRVHRFLEVQHLRPQLRQLGELGLHVGINLSRSESLFGRDWDKCAREMGHRLRERGVKTIVRGPGADHPLGALDSYVVDQVRACHDRALTAAMHYGAERYLITLDSTFGISRSARMARLEATATIVQQLATAAKSRGMSFGVEQQLEHDDDAIDVILDALRSVGAGLVFNPALSACSGEKDVAAAFERCRDVVVGIDLTDRLPHDLEPRSPGTGILESVESLPEMMQTEGLELFCLDVPMSMTAESVTSLNSLARRSSELQEV